MEHSESGSDLARQNPGEQLLLEEYRNIAAINDLRRYFAENHPIISPYLYLPKTSELPRARSLGHVQWYLSAMTLIGAIYEYLGVFSVIGRSFYIGISAALIYCLIFYLLKRIIYKGYPN